jgi:3'-5' exoribonuclease
MVDKDTVVECRIFQASDKIIEMVKEGLVYDGVIDVKPYDKSSTGFSCIMYNMDYSKVPPEYFADWAENLEGSRAVIENMLGSYYDTYYGQIAYPIIVRNWDKFSKWTAASSMHHTQLGGLLTHTAEVVTLSDKIADYFNDKYGDNFINKPLLLCAAALHDIGKTKELDVNTLSGKTEYSENAIFSSHIMDILAEVELQAKELGFGNPNITDENGTEIGTKSDETIADEKEALLLLKHCLAAHHGKLEYGSPITASVPEAVILNIADNMSAEMYRYNRELKKLEPGEYSTAWIQGELNKYYKDTSKIDDMECN